MTITHQESSKKTKFQTKKSFQGPNCKMWIYIRTKYPGVPSSGLHDEISQDTISQDEIRIQQWRNIITMTKLEPRWYHITGKMTKTEIHWRHRYWGLRIEIDRKCNEIWKLEYQADHAKTISVTRHDLTRRNMKTPMKDQQDMISKKKYEDTDERPTWT